MNKDVKINAARINTLGLVAFKSLSMFSRFCTPNAALKTLIRAVSKEMALFSFGFGIKLLS